MYFYFFFLFFPTELSALIYYSRHSTWINEKRRRKNTRTECATLLKCLGVGEHDLRCNQLACGWVGSMAVWVVKVNGVSVLRGNLQFSFFYLSLCLFSCVYFYYFLFHKFYTNFFMVVCGSFYDKKNRTNNIHSAVLL